MKTKRFIIFTLILALACSTCAFVMTGCFTSAAAQIAGAYRLDFAASDAEVAAYYPDTSAYATLAPVDDEMRITFRFDAVPEDTDVPIWDESSFRFSDLSVYQNTFIGAFYDWTPWSANVSGRIQLTGNTLTVEVSNTDYEIFGLKMVFRKITAPNDNSEHDAICSAYGEAGYRIDTTSSVSDDATVQAVISIFKSYEALGYRVSCITKNLGNTNQEFYLLVTTNSENEATEIEQSFTDTGMYPCRRRGCNVIVSIGLTGPTNFQPFEK